MLKKGSYKMNRSWIYVYLSGITEILWAIGLKYSDAWWEWVLTFTLIIMAFVLTIKASEALPVATVYVVFTGIGAAGTNLVDILVFREPVSVMKIVFIVLLIAGIIGLKLVTDKPEGRRGGIDSVAVAGRLAFAGGCSNDTDGCCVSHTGANAEVAALEAADSKQTREVRVDDGAWIFLVLAGCFEACRRYRYEQSHRKEMFQFLCSTHCGIFTELRTSQSGAEDTAAGDVIRHMDRHRIGGSDTGGDDMLRRLTAV